MQETSLHAALKAWYAQSGDSLEVPVDGYLVDVVHKDLLVEIQTRNFSAIKPKLTRLLQDHPVRLVHPIAVEKWIVRLPAGEDSPPARRKSPRRGRMEHLFLELVRIPHLVAHPNFSVEVLLTREEEVRRDDGQGSWRRKGWSIADRRLLEVVERRVLVDPVDFSALLPDSLPMPFTNRDLSQKLQIPLYLAQRMVYCLRAMGVVDTAGRKGRACLFNRIEPIR